MAGSRMLTAEVLAFTTKVDRHVAASTPPVPAAVATPPAPCPTLLPGDESMPPMPAIPLPAEHDTLRRLSTLGERPYPAPHPLRASITADRRGTLDRVARQVPPTTPAPGSTVGPCELLISIT